MRAATDRPVINFNRGIPLREAIPTKDLATQTAAIIDERPDVMFQYPPMGQYLGDPELRLQLAALHSVDPERIFVGTGSLQVLDLLAGHLLGDRNRDVYVEAPTYDRALQIFDRHGARVLGLPLEDDGLDIELLHQHLRTLVPVFLYTIPDFQNPSGVTMSEAKRRALVGLSETYGFTILEDAPYRQLRYHGAALPSLAQMAGGARVVTIDSLSKVLSPGLRVGYAISDADTSLALASLAECTYLSPVPLCQAVAARCLAAGVVASNIGWLRQILGPRRDEAVVAVRSFLGDALFAAPDGGYFISAHLRTDVDEATFLAALRAEGIALAPGSAFYPPPATPPAGTLFIRLPFQALNPDDFAFGVELLGKVAEKLSR